MQQLFALKKIILGLFLALLIGACFLIPNLKFTFDFGQFFPEGDEDLEFYQDFVKDFGSDDSFLLIAVENAPNILDQDFLNRVNNFTLAAKKLPHTKSSQSLTTLFYPLKTSFGYQKLPIFTIKDTTRYAKNWERLQQDEVFMNALVDRQGTALVIALETEDELGYEPAIELLNGARSLLKEHDLNKSHFLGRAYFYETIIQMQQRELMVTTIVAAILVCIILFLVYRQTTVILITLASIIASLLLFLGVLAAFKIELNALAALYPVLMLIVGTSDVIHIMDSFLVKLRQGEAREAALMASLKEVGLITLLTSVTTAIGFASLLSSRLASIRHFGINSSIGVLVAYVTVIFLTSALLLMVPPKKLLLARNTSFKWNTLLSGLNKFTINQSGKIVFGSLLFFGICLYGISKITTNYQFSAALPRGSAIAADLDYFQEKFTGFRPLEVAVTTQGDYKITNFDIITEIDKVEQKLKSFEAVGNVQSPTLLYKGLHRANNLNKQSEFVLPKSEVVFNKYNREIQKLSGKQMLKFIDSSQTKARITTRVLDIGADSLAQLYKTVYKFIKAETDSTKVKFRLTGQGLLLDKNAIYARDSLLQGLALGLLLVGILMTFLYRNWKLVLLSLVPNLLPLLFAGALLGYFNIPLEASITIVFAIVFGIAVDDTIHFLGKYRILLAKGLNKEEAMAKTFSETGRALIITTVILFFGFMVLLFSVSQPSVIIGMLISATLFTALILDLLLLPVLMRKFL